jgi:hypothetical protein
VCADQLECRAALPVSIPAKSANSAVVSQRDI